MASSALEVTHFSDPGCPWAYSAWPALTTLMYRYGVGLDWRLELIGLSESRDRYEARGYTPARMARGYRNFRKRGMPFATEPREQIPPTGRACRAVVAVGLRQPDQQLAAFRALQFGWFTTTLDMFSDDGIRTALELAPAVDADAVVAAIEDPAVEEAYQRGRERARAAAGSPAEAQGRTANSDGDERYTAPSLLFARSPCGARRPTSGSAPPAADRLEVGGFQPVEAYDVCIANLDPGLPRRDEATDPVELLASRPEGLTTREVAAAAAGHLRDPDDAATEDSLIELASEGRVTRTQLGNGALWRAA